MSTTGADAAADKGHPAIAATPAPPSASAPHSQATPLFAFTLSPSSATASASTFDARSVGASSPLPPTFTFASPATPLPPPQFTPFAFASPAGITQPGADAVPPPSAPASFALPSSAFKSATDAAPTAPSASFALAPSKFSFPPAGVPSGADTPAPPTALALSPSPFSLVPLGAGADTPASPTAPASLTLSSSPFSFSPLGAAPEADSSPPTAALALPPSPFSFSPLGAGADTPAPLTAPPLASTSFALGAPSRSPKKKTPAKQTSKAEPKQAAQHTITRPPRVTCTKAIQHAAQDGTQTYFSLLPPELCTELDRLCRLRWCFEPVLYAVSLPEILVEPEKITYSHLLWHDKEALAISASAFPPLKKESSGWKGKPTPTMTHIVFYPDDSPTRVVTIDDEFIGSMTVASDRQPLLHYGGGYPYFGGQRLRDIEGNVLHSWQDNSLSMRPLPEFRNGWAFTQRECTWTWLYELGTTYTLPPLGFWCRSWYAFFVNKEPHVYVAGDDKDGQRVFQVWRLKTQTLVWERIIQDPMRGQAYTMQKVFVLTSAHPGKLPTLQIFSLSTGAPLLSEVSGYWPGGGLYDRVIILEHEQRSGSTINFWDPLEPEKVSAIDFLDWEVLWVFHGVVLAKRGKDEVLLWDIDYGCGVRAPGLSLQAKVGYRAGGGFIATCPDATYVIPMPVNRKVRKRLPLPSRVPDNVPISTPRRLTSGCSEAFPSVGMEPVVRHGNGILTPPVFVHAGKLWVFG